MALDDPPLYSLRCAPRKMLWVLADGCGERQRRLLLQWLVPDPHLRGSDRKGHDLEMQQSVHVA